MHRERAWGVPFAVAPRKRGVAAPTALEAWVMDSNALGRGLVLVAISCALACSSEPPSKYPPRERGCNVEVFPDEPSYATEDIGAVRTMCDRLLSEAECVRKLQDRACRLGADTLSGTRSGVELYPRVQIRSGRAGRRK